MTATTAAANLTEAHRNGTEAWKLEDMANEYISATFATAADPTKAAGRRMANLRRAGWDTTNQCPAR